MLDYYLNLLIIQYYEKPNIRSTLSAIIDNVLANDIYSSVKDAFNIDTATGEQLDTIAKYVGVDRFYSGQEFTGENFAMLTYTEDTPTTEQVGFSDYSDFETKTGKWLQYADVVNGGLSLADEDFRTLIKLKIIQNNINHSHASVDNSIADFFGSSIRAESTGDMTMDYFTPKNLTAVIQVAIEKEVLPRPMGVALRYLIVETSTLFGMATYGNETPPFNIGFSTYSTFDTDVGEMLTYNKIMEA